MSSVLLSKQPKIPLRVSRSPHCSYRSDHHSIFDQINVLLSHRDAVGGEQEEDERTEHIALKDSMLSIRVEAEEPQSEVNLVKKSSAHAWVLVHGCLTLTR